MTEDEEFEALEQRLNYKPKEQAMNRDEIAQMMQDSAGNSWGTEAHFQRFAALVAAAEREACAKVVEDVDPSPNPIINMTNRLAAAAIRAKGASNE